MIEVREAEYIHGVAFGGRAQPSGLPLFPFLDDDGQILETPIPRIAVRHLAGLASPLAQHLSQIRKMIGDFSRRPTFPRKHLARVQEPLTCVTRTLAKVLIAPGIDELFFDGHAASYLV